MAKEGRLWHHTDLGSNSNSATYWLILWVGTVTSGLLFSPLGNGGHLVWLPHGSLDMLVKSMLPAL